MDYHEDYKMKEDDNISVFENYDTNITINFIKDKYKKKYISKSLKIKVWNTYIGKETGCHLCMCCKHNEITQMNFEAGHIKSERYGGETNVENLRPICGICNKSMKCKDMREFMCEYGLGTLDK